ncbi:MAG: universal stress protein [Candidatus Nitrotoga sp.]
MLKRILAATDLSAFARHAVERAALVSQETGSSLDLLHVANLAPLERLRQLMMETPEGLQQRVLDARA